jgi:hypothetical protein
VVFVLARIYDRLMIVELRLFFVFTRSGLGDGQPECDENGLDAK